MIVFAILAAIVLMGAVWVVSLRNLFRAALSLGMVLLGVAGIFILLEAEFLAFVQILVYVGAVLTLIVFAIMLTSRLENEQALPSRPLSGPASSQVASQQRLPAAAISFSLFALLVGVTGPLLWPAVPSGPAVQVANVGQQLVTELVLPFEVISLVFVAAIVGAIVIASGLQQGKR